MKCAIFIRAGRAVQYQTQPSAPQTSVPGLQLPSGELHAASLCCLGLTSLLISHTYKPRTGCSDSSTGALLGEGTRVKTVSHHPGSENTQGWGRGTKAKVLLLRLICCYRVSGHTGLWKQRDFFILVRCMAQQGHFQLRKTPFSLFADG